MNDENNTVTAAEQPAVAEGADTPAPVATEETTEGDVQAEKQAPEYATGEPEPEQQAPATAAE